MDRAPAMPRWVLWIIAIFIADLLICTAVGAANHSISTFLSASLFCGLPIWLIAAVFIALANAGKRARTFCGYCGYDRTGLTIETLCPECGNDGTSLAAPGHQPVGKRPLPIWVWLPIVLVLPGVLVAARLTNGRGFEFVVLCGLGLIVCMLIAGAYQAWHQAR